MTTATGSAEQVQFLTGMEPPTKEDWQEVTVETGRKLWTIHGMAHRVLEALGIVQSRALSMAERGPSDYADDTENDFERGVRVGARYGGYREAPKGDGNLKAVIIGCTITLLSAFVIGAWKLSNDSAAFRAEFVEWKQATTRWMEQSERRFDRLENRRP
jgi:hypothetical protein